ncbi:911_t:CDS:1, partial [Dentiscutata erythropus]
YINKIPEIYVENLYMNDLMIFPNIEIVENQNTENTEIALEEENGCLECNNYYQLTSYSAPYDENFSSPPSENFEIYQKENMYINYTNYQLPSTTKRACTTRINWKRQQWIFR